MFASDALMKTELNPLKSMGAFSSNKQNSITDFLLLWFFIAKQLVYFLTNGCKFESNIFFCFPPFVYLAYGKSPGQPLLYGGLKEEIRRRTGNAKAFIDN